MPDTIPPRDVGVRPLPKLNWAADQREQSINQLIDYVADEAQEIIGWYLRKKQGKRLGARSLRGIAVLATGAAAIVPLIAQLYPASLQPGWASVALVVVAAAIALDRFFGYSSAWMRYLATEMQVRHALHRYLMQIELMRAELAGKQPELADIRRYLARCTDFLLGLHDTVRDETAVWSTELRSVLREMEAEARVHNQQQPNGSLRLTVTNGDEATDGWAVTLDGDRTESHKGPTAVLANVTPGRRTVEVRATLAGQERAARRTVTVTSGETATVELTLPAGPPDATSGSPAAPIAG
jgi:hypothetical protein